MKGFDEFGRPSWDTLWMSLCFTFAQRSLDAETKHGCVVVDDDNTLLSMGYNSPSRGCVDKYIPKTRPEKYANMRHAEENAISNAARIGVSLKGSIFYITGHPCHNCFGMIKNVGAKKIIYGHVGSACLKDDESLAVIERLQFGNPIELVMLDPVAEVLGDKSGEAVNVMPVKDLLVKASDYFDARL